MSMTFFTDRSVADIPFVKGGQAIVRDTDLAGFFLIIGARTKTYTVQGDLRVGGIRQTVRLKVGTTKEMSAREARAKAKRLLGDILAGIDPRAKLAEEAPTINAPPVGPTLRSAWSSYLASHLRRKGRSEDTIDDYRDHVERLMAPWLDISLARLGEEPMLVKERHDQLTEENGPYMANSCMRTLRAIYNHARKTARELPPENPVIAVDWNPERRRDTGMGPEDLPGWLSQLRAIDNPLRRELHLLILLSGSRPDPIKRIQVSHIDFRKRQIFVPKPKGGEAKAFFIPLSRQMMSSISRAMKIGRLMHPQRAMTWLFPADSSSGHIVEHKEDRETLSHWGNDLRQTYRTAGQFAGINDIDMHLLMNHSVPGVNAGYITRAKLVSSHLRSAQQELSDFLLASLADDGDVSSKWPAAPLAVLLRDEFPTRLDADRGRGGQRCSRNMAVFREAVISA